MGLWAGELLVVTAKSAGNFAEGDGALGAGMALPEEGESLAADGAAELRGISGALAQNLHVFSGLSTCRCSSNNRGTLALEQVS
jgi:hypothetical protein